MQGPFSTIPPERPTALQTAYEGFGARSAEPAGLARSCRCVWVRGTSTVLPVTPRMRNGAWVARYACGMLGTCRAVAAGGGSETLRPLRGLVAQSGQSRPGRGYALARPDASRTRCTRRKSSAAGPFSAASHLSGWHARTSRFATAGLRASRVMARSARRSHEHWRLGARATPPS